MAPEAPGSPPENGPPSPLSRWLGVPLLVAYSTLLVLAALVPEIRPAWLDGTHRFAAGVLDYAGIRAGHVLMESNYPTDYRFQAYCMVVRGSAPGREPVYLFPDENGVCPDRGIRPRLPPMERALYRFLRNAWWKEILAERSGDPAGILRGRAKNTLSRIGRHYCQREELRGAEGARIDLAWYAYEVAYSTGERRRGNFLHFGWLCDEDRLVALRWFPDDVAMIGFWGGSPWQ